jgi:hypothetical protein
MFAAFLVQVSDNSGLELGGICDKMIPLICLSIMISNQTQINIDLIELDLLICLNIGRFASSTLSAVSDNGH